ncbi:MAG TPA: formyltransferase family protein [Thermoleophilaceae bacterium]|nr:formyltransferase family protein [Thermoleophilaceae bacterium]
MKAVFMGKCKRSATSALAWLVDRGCDIPAVVCAPPDDHTRPEQRLDLVARDRGLPLVTDDDLYAAIADPGGSPLDLEGVDVVISFLFWKRIREPLISLGRVGCLNFHPAPLPDMRGLGGYNVAILEGRGDWGVSCHFVEETFDTGDLVAVDRFPIDPDTATALSLDIESQERLLALFERVMSLAMAGDELPRTPQGEGRYVSRDELEALRRVRPGDDLDRKLRAFWYPPWPGAVLEVDGRVLTLVDEGLLADAAEAYREAGRIP